MYNNKIDTTSTASLNHIYATSAIPSDISAAWPSSISISNIPESQNICFTIKSDEEFFNPEKIKAIKEIVPEKVYLFTFNDDTKIKTIRSEEDPFDLEYMIYLAIAKKIYAKDYTFEGVLNKVNELRLQKRYVKFAEQAMKLFKKLQKAREKGEEEKLIKQRQHERYVRCKKAAKEKKRKEQINIIAEAIKLSKEG